MIVRETSSGLVLITQPDHARLARQIVEPWAALGEAARRRSILHAVQEHDNGWREPDSSPIVDPAAGRILDFINAPVRTRQDVWPRGVARLTEDPWAAALVAQHALTIYERYREAPEWAAFFERMTAARDVHMKASGHTLDELRADYAFVRLGDLASLAFCNLWTDEHAVGGIVMRLEGSRLLISPDPYGGKAVGFEVTGRELPQRAFASEEEARAAFEAAPIVTLTGIAVGIEG